MKRVIICFALFLAVLQVKADDACPILFVGSTPSTNATVTSLNEVVFHFDFSNVIASKGENENYGVSYYGYKGSSTRANQSVQLIKGDESGTVLKTLCNSAVKPNNSSFKTGYDLTLDFSGIEIEAGQTYTIKSTNYFYAGIKGETNHIMDSRLDCLSTPIVLTFIGASETSKVLKLEDNNLPVNSGLTDTKNGINLTFNYDIAVANDASATIKEGDNIIASANSFSVDTDGKTLLVSFPEETVYAGHTYTFNLPAGAVTLADDPSVGNSEISLTFEGASTREFSAGRIRTDALLDLIQVPFDFPTYNDGTETWNTGFVDPDHEKLTSRKMYVYEGEYAVGDDLPAEATFILDGDAASSSTLQFSPTCAFMPGATYTFVIPAGAITPYLIGDSRYRYLKDYKSAEVRFTKKAPSIDELPEYSLAAYNVADGATVEHVGNVHFTGLWYVYDDKTYGYQRVNTLKPALYEVADTRANNLVKECNWYTTQIEVEGVSQHMLIVEVDKDLIKGKSYQLVLPEGLVVVSSKTVSETNNGSNFLNKNVKSQALTLNLVGNYIPKLTCSINGVAAIATPVNPGDQVTVSFPENDGFQLASLSYNGEDQTVADSFTTPAIEDDASLEANYEYKGTIHFDYTTGVDVVDCPFTVTNDGDVVRITGVEGKAITVYAINGMVMGSFEEATQNVVNITLARDQVYIIKIGDQVLKIQH